MLCKNSSVEKLQTSLLGGTFAVLTSFVGTGSGWKIRSNKQEEGEGSEEHYCLINVIHWIRMSFIPT